jgi:hypothetical protein
MPSEVGSPQIASERRGVVRVFIAVGRLQMRPKLLPDSQEQTQDNREAVPRSLPAKPVAKAFA